ncbi:MAG: hypothetical protein ACJZ9F_07220 [Rhodospirillaceae bacterium]
MGYLTKACAFFSLMSVALAANQITTKSLAQSAPSPKPLMAERLVMPLFPTGWREFIKEGGAVEVVEYLPDEQSLKIWQDKIILQVYHDLNDLPLDAIQRRTQGQNRNRCTAVIEGPLQSGLNNGYPAAFWTLGCRYVNANGFGETHYIKAIQGTAALYVLSRVWRTQPFGQDGPAIDPAALDKGISFLTTSVVCIPNSAMHPCAIN